MSDRQTDTILRTTKIEKAYDGVQALRGVDFELRAGEVHALVGENGAGKSTFIKIITGAVSPDGGSIELGGAPLANNSPRLAKERGIAAIYQQPSLFPELTVAENIALGLEDGQPWRRVNWQLRRTRARELLARIGARIDVDDETGNLSMPQQQLVEIVRALGARSNVLILDEPTASLSDEETENLFRVIRQLRAQGAGVIYISHRLEELFAIADRVTILRDGAVVGEYSVAELNRSQLISLMVGRELSAIFPKSKPKIGETVIEIRDLGCSNNGLHDVNFSLRSGEILGLAGLVGAGRTELARTLFGLDPADAGQIVFKGKSIQVNNPSEAIGQRIAYVPEDRRRHGVILDMSISANISLASLKRLSRWARYDFQRERELAADYARRFAIKSPSIFNPVSTLSGGNQQKVALSRWLATKPLLLILDEPTQGIDVGTKAEIHALMSELTNQGMAILMISSELPEILGMSDRIAVMREGTIVEMFAGSEATQERLLTAALGQESSAE